MAGKTIAEKYLPNEGKLTRQSLALFARLSSKSRRRVVDELNHSIFGSSYPKEVDVLDYVARFGNCAVHAAVDHEDTAALGRLLDLRQTPKRQQVFMRACMNGKIASAAFLLATIADPEEKRELAQHALRLTAWAGQAPMCRWLCENGAQVGASVDYDDHPLVADFLSHVLVSRAPTSYFHDTMHTLMIMGAGRHFLPSTPVAEANLHNAPWVSAVLIHELRNDDYFLEALRPHMLCLEERSREWWGSDRRIVMHEALRGAHGDSTAFTPA